MPANGDEKIEIWHNFVLIDIIRKMPTYPTLNNLLIQSHNGLGSVGRDQDLKSAYASTYVRSTMSGRAEWPKRRNGRSNDVKRSFFTPLLLLFAQRSINQGEVSSNSRDSVRQTDERRSVVREDRDPLFKDLLAVGWPVQLGSASSAALPWMYVHMKYEEIGGEKVYVARDLEANLPTQMIWLAYIDYVSQL